jgi:DNA-binding CsgD family transcriptional regulator
MKSFDQRFSELLLDVYEAAADPQHWTLFLEHAAREMDATKAALHVHYFAPGDTTRTAEGSCAVAIGYDAASLTAYAGYYAAQDVYVQRIRERFPFGMNAGTSEDLLTPGELRKTELYHDYCRTNEVFHTCWSAVEQTKGIAAGLGFIRPESSRPFKKKDVHLLKLLNPHLNKAFRLQRILEQSSAHSNALVSGMAHFDFGVIALGADGCITNVSGPAKTLLDARDGIQAKTSRLEANDQLENQHLQRMLADAISPLHRPHRPVANSLLVSRNSGKRPLQVVVYPFVSSRIMLEDRPTALVFVTDPTLKPVSRASVLQTLYGLTPTESRLADLLLEGLEVRETASRLKMTLETARFHLKRVLTKTGTHRQTELMRLMLSLPGVV